MMRSPARIAPAHRAEPRLSEWAATSRRLTGDYLDSISAPNSASLAATPLFYGRYVHFYGQDMDAATLVAEKRRFFRRWPLRAYAPAGSMRAACSATRATCTVRTLVRFQTASPGLDARARGLLELVLTISFAGERAVIADERSRVLRWS